MDNWDLRILRSDQLETLEATVQERRHEGWHLMCLVARVRPAPEEDGERRVGPPFLAVLQRGEGTTQPEMPAFRLMGDSARVLSRDVEQARVTADLLASEGQVAQGYTLLLGGLEAARSAEAGRPALGEATATWQSAVEDYCRRHGDWLR